MEDDEDDEMDPNGIKNEYDDDEEEIKYKGGNESPGIEKINGDTGNTKERTKAGHTKGKNQLKRKKRHTESDDDI